MTTYLPGGEKMRYTNGTVVWHSYVMGEGQRVGEVIRTTPLGGSTTVLTRYYVNDWQGSVSAIVDNNYLNETTNTEFDSYDAWGKRRFPSSYAEDWNNTLSSETVHGYTNQEHLTDVGLIHLNARVYDPYVGRFLSVDPVVGMPEDLQSWNGYSYAGNNPMAFTDPSGMCFLGCFWKPVFHDIGSFFRHNQDVLKIAAGVGCTIATGGNVLAGAECAGASNFGIDVVSGDKIGAALEDGALTFAEAEAFNFVGDNTGFDKVHGGLVQFSFSNLAQDKAVLENVAGHALVGGTFAVIEGGRFGSGALAAGFSASVSPYLHYVPGGFAGGLAASAVVGGTGSVLGGGKFGNGALTASYGYLFNACGGPHGCFNAGVATGTAVGIAGSTGCDVGTVGACVIVDPIIVGSTAVVGGVVGGIEDAWGDLTSGIGNILYARPPANAWDVNGPKAPGYPGGVGGYTDPKGGPNWVPNPNGSGNGWESGDGTVWVPTGQGGLAHGGPHWDVQTPGGGYENVYPPKDD